jgi:hypothetical protein
VRSIPPAHRAVAVLAAVVALTAGVAGSAQAAKGGKGGKPPATTTITTTTTSAAGIKSVHDSVCPTVGEYTPCAGLSVTVAAFGAVGWTASSGPAAGTVEYNSSQSHSTSTWAAVVAHEVGGHHDAWRELVAKVGTTQAWTDYYDLDYFGEVWAEARYLALKGTARDFTRSEGKETYLDCAGPVDHGARQGFYLSRWGFSAGTAQQTFCQGSATVMTNALTKVRPS